MKEGLRYFFGPRDLKLIIGCAASFFFLMTPAGVLTPLMVARSFGPEVWRLTANELAWAGASLIGGILVARHGDFKAKPAALALCMGIFGLSFGLMGLVENFILYLILMAVGGLFILLFMTAETVFIQQTADPAKLGRVFSISQILANSAMPTAVIIFGPLADIVSVESLLLITGVLMVGVGLAYYKASRPFCNPDSQLSRPIDRL